MRRILIIDDDVVFRQMLRTMLERAEYEIIEAADGREGMRLFREAPVDLVITDILMPEQDGVETVIQLRREFADVGIIAISGGGQIGSKEYLKVAEGFGVTHTFSKPLDRKRLLKAIQELLGNVQVP